MEQVKDVDASSGNGFNAFDVACAAFYDFIVVGDEKDFFTSEFEVVDECDDFFRLRSCEIDFVEDEQFVCIDFIASDCLRNNYYLEVG